MEFRTVAVAVLTAVILVVLILLAISIGGMLESGVNESIGFMGF